MTRPSRGGVGPRHLGGAPETARCLAVLLAPFRRPPAMTAVSPAAMADAAVQAFVANPGGLVDGLDGRSIVHESSMIQVGVGEAGDSGLGFVKGLSPLGNLLPQAGTERVPSALVGEEGADAAKDGPPVLPSMEDGQGESRTLGSPPEGKATLVDDLDPGIDPIASRDAAFAGEDPVFPIGGGGPAEIQGIHGRPIQSLVLADGE